MNAASAPFFSIGVATYRRRDFLMQNLDSIRAQTFSDLEVIIGNNHEQEILSIESFGIEDARIRIINHRRDLGVLGNMNALLGAARGRYFTWLNDDDLYDRRFLSSVFEAISACNFPRCIFTSYTMGRSVFEHPTLSGNMEHLTGREFLRRYLSRSVKTLGCYGVFERNYLTDVGGMLPLGNGFPVYSDNLLAIRAGLLERVVYIDSPLIFFREHEGSISATSLDMDSYFRVQIDLCRRCVGIFHQQELRPDFSANLYFLLEWCIRDMIAVIRRRGGVEFRQVVAYLAFVAEYIRMLNGQPRLRRKVTGLLVKGMLRLPLSVAKDRIVGLFNGTERR
jgi:glycosyltransferase involved in cell wall biosynthesis